MRDTELVSLAHGIAQVMLRQGQIPWSVDVEDLAQAGMVSALMARGRYDETRGASIRTFLAIRIRGAIRDEVQRQMRTHVENSYEALGEIHQAPGHNETPERHVMHHELLTRLSTEIDGLPARDRWVLEMKYQDDLTQREIGTVLGVTEARVSQIHSRIVDKLRVLQ